VSDVARGRAAVLALVAVLAVTASWWALALWPVGAGGPQWVLRTRDVCFGARGDALPSPGGWLLLAGQPVGMLLLLAFVWGPELRGGLARTMSHSGGQVMAGVMLAMTMAGLTAVAARVRDAGGEAFAASPARIAADLTRVNDPSPRVALIAQTGETVTLEQFRGRPVIVAFAYAHCETVCPRIVSEVLTASRAAAGPRPAVLFVTLDPWRDTPRRLPVIATLWGLTGDAYVLSGAPDDVERTISAWRVPRTRNLKTGDISHPAMIHVVGPDGRIAYVVTGGADTIAAALSAL
jgi:protein SCO1/2